MTRDRKPLDLVEKNDLMPMEDRGGSVYALVNPRRSRKGVAVVCAPPLDVEPAADRGRPEVLARGTQERPALQHVLERMVADDEDARPTRRFRSGDLRKIAEASDPPKPSYRDPALCSCTKMLRALEARTVMVIVAGPVTLSPAVIDDGAIGSGAVDAARLGRAYDGKPWAFRHCPFSGCLIDDQVEILPQPDPMSCCGTMALALLHGRVELPDTAHIDDVAGRFIAPGRAATLFTHCPWCATETIDLVIARHKRSRGL